MKYSPHKESINLQRYASLAFPASLSSFSLAQFFHPRKSFFCAHLIRPGNTFTEHTCFLWSVDPRRLSSFSPSHRSWINIARSAAVLLPESGSRIIKIAWRHYAGAHTSVCTQAVGCLSVSPSRGKGGLAPARKLSTSAPLPHVIFVIQPLRRVCVYVCMMHLRIVPEEQDEPTRQSICD